MRTTIRLSEDVLRRAKARAAEHGQSLTSYIERVVRDSLQERDAEVADYPPIPVSTELGWVRPGVNIDKTSELLDMLDAEDGKWR